MNIAQIAPPWLTIPPNRYGGTENVIYHLVEELVSQGHNVTLFAPGDAKTSARHISFFPRSLSESGIPWPANLKAYYHLHKAVEQASNGDFDIVHTHLSSTTDMYIFPLMASLTIPHITTLHSHFPFDRAATSDWIGDADHYYMKWASKTPMIAISETARTQALAQFPLNFAGVVHYGVPLHVYRSLRGPREDFFVWLGRFSPEKGAHHAIQAAKQANVPLILAGIVDHSRKEAYDYFRKEIEPHLDGTRIRYIGPVTTAKKIKLFSRARGCLNPIACEEPFSMVMIEALALGCPVIAFAGGVACEIILHEETGFLVNTVDEMARAIPHIDEIDRQVLRMYVDRRFSAHVMARNYLRVYTNVIQDHKKSALSSLGDTTRVPPGHPANRYSAVAAKDILPLQTTYP